MKVELHRIKVKDVFRGFEDDGEDGVFAYGGNLTIRPPYQREFVYDTRQQEEVIYTVLKGFPLNIMYWVKTGENTCEVLDGQQRTLSIMSFLSHKLQVKIDEKTYYSDSLPNDLYDKILNYEFMVYVCEGTESEKLAWFQVVNIAGEKLTAQEIRNSVYTGEWLSDAKRHFSKRNCPAKGLSDKYIKGDPIHQELLETALKGICGFQELKDISDYMAAHRSDTDADELWQYFQDVISWIEKIFPVYNKTMHGLDWCLFYNEFHENKYNSAVMTKEVSRLMADDEVAKKSGIYPYLLSRDSDPFAAKLLNLRAFPERDKKAAYERQKGVCPICKKHFQYDEMAGDHIKPWSKGGLTIPENCQMLCKSCNSKKSDMY